MSRTTRPGASGVEQARSWRVGVRRMPSRTGATSPTSSLNSSMFNGARLIGASIAGVLIAVVGEGGCFLLDDVRYLAVIASLLAMTVRPRQPREEQKHVLQDLREGWRYAS